MSSCLTLLMLMLMPAVAAAEPTSKTYEPCARPPTDNDVTAAKGAFQAGNASFDEADYPRAIVYWEDAYRRDCTAHALLLNLARAYELNGDKRQAAEALEAYLLRVPKAPEKDKIRRRIEVLLRVVEPLAVADAPAAPAQEPVPAESSELVGPSLRADVKSETPSPSASRPIAPLIVAGAGAAIAIVGGVLYVTARGDLNEANARCPDHRCPNEPTLTNDANKARLRVNISAGVTIGGLVLAGGGLAWYFLVSPKARASPSTSVLVLPSFGSNFARLELRAGF